MALATLAFLLLLGGAHPAPVTVKLRTVRQQVQHLHPGLDARQAMCGSVCIRSEKALRESTLDPLDGKPKPEKLKSQTLHPRGRWRSFGKEAGVMRRR